MLVGKIMIYRQQQQKGRCWSDHHGAPWRRGSLPIPGPERHDRRLWLGLCVEKRPNRDRIPRAPAAIGLLHDEVARSGSLPRLAPIHVDRASGRGEAADSLCAAHPPSRLVLGPPYAKRRLRAAVRAGRRRTASPDADRRDLVLGSSGPDRRRDRLVLHIRSRADGRRELVDHRGSARGEHPSQDGSSHFPGPTLDDAAVGQFPRVARMNGKKTEKRAHGSSRSPFFLFF